MLNKREDLKKLLQSLNDLPEVIAVTGFKPKNLVHSLRLSEIQLDGHNVFCHRLDSSTNRGVLLYVATDVQVSLVDMPSAFEEHNYIYNA